MCVHVPQMPAARQKSRRSHQRKPDGGTAKRALYFQGRRAQKELEAQYLSLAATQQKWAEQPCCLRGRCSEEYNANLLHRLRQYLAALSKDNVRAFVGERIVVRNHASDRKRRHDTMMEKPGVLKRLLDEVEGTSRRLPKPPPDEEYVGHCMSNLLSLGD